MPEPDVSAWWRRLARPDTPYARRADWADFAGARWADGILQTRVTDDFHAKQGTLDRASGPQQRRS